MSSQITWSLTGAWNLTRPIQYVAQTDINAIPTASPAFIAADIIGEINPTFDHVSFDVEAVGNRFIRDMLTTGHNAGFSLNHFPYNLPLLKYLSEPPNETTPAGTSAEYLGFLQSYKQAVGAGNVEHFVKYEGAKGNSLEMSVDPEGLVTATSEWLCRNISLPNTAHGLTTPVFVEHAATTGTPLSHTDNGPTPLRVAGTDFPCGGFNIRWNNNLRPDRYNGSTLIDALTVTNIRIEGSVTVPVGKNLQFETKIRELQQAQMTMSYVFKAATMVVNLTGVEFSSYNPVVNASSNDTWAWEWPFKAETAGLGTAIV